MFLFHREFVTFSCAALLFPAVLGAQSGNSSDETTTHTAQTINNTAACSVAGYGFESGPYCGDAFAGFWDSLPNILRDCIRLVLVVAVVPDYQMARPESALRRRGPRFR